MYTEDLQFTKDDKDTSKSCVFDFPDAPVDPTHPQTDFPDDPIDDWPFIDPGVRPTPGSDPDPPTLPPGIPPGSTPIGGPHLATILRGFASANIVPGSFEDVMTFEYESNVGYSGSIAPNDTTTSTLYLGGAGNSSSYLLKVDRSKTFGQNRSVQIDLTMAKALLPSQQNFILTVRCSLPGLASPPFDTQWAQFGAPEPPYDFGSGISYFLGNSFNNYGDIYYSAVDVTVSYDRATEQFYHKIALTIGGHYPP